MNRRAEILHELARFENPSAPLLSELQAFGWDWPQDEPLLILKREDLTAIIDRFLAGKITAAQLQEWAENLECREDVAFDKTNEGILNDVFFRLATPFINDPLTVESVSKMRVELFEKNQ